MNKSLTAPPTPQPDSALTLDPDEVQMPSHAMRIGPEPAWSVIHATSSGAFLPIGSVVPINPPVFNAPEAPPAPPAENYGAELDAMGITYEPSPWPGPVSGSCATRWPTGYVGDWICTLPRGHSSDIPCEAQGVKGAVLASKGQERTTTTALVPVRRVT